MSSYPHSTPHSFYLVVLSGIPPNIYGFLLVTKHSPNFEYLARYYSLRGYHSFKREGYYDGMTSEEFDALNERERLPGFDLYDLNADTNLYIDVNGEFLQWLEWSPESNYIAIGTYDQSETEPGNIYVYDVDKGTLTQVGDFLALFNWEYGPYVSTWSSDEQWLAINTFDGRVAYNLLSGESIELNTGPIRTSVSEFTEVYMRLFWSPIMDYSISECD